MGGNERCCLEELREKLPKEGDLKAFWAQRLKGQFL